LSLESKEFYASQQKVGRYQHAAARMILESRIRGKNSLSLRHQNELNNWQLIQVLTEKLFDDGNCNIRVVPKQKGGQQKVIHPQEFKVRKVEFLSIANSAHSRLYETKIFCRYTMHLTQIDSPLIKGLSHAPTGYSRYEMGQEEEASHPNAGKFHVLRVGLVCEHISNSVEGDD